jgi:hypothetical protein
MLTLSAARSVLWRYGSPVPYATASSDDKAAFDERLNAVCERFLRAGHSDRVPVALTTYLDACNNAYITLPYELNTILASVNGNGCSGYPLTIRSDWYEYLPNNIGLGTGPCSDIIAIPGKFTTYQDWNTPMRLRFKMEKAETTKFIVRGKLSNDKIYTDDEGNWIEGVAITYLTDPVTTTQLFDEPPYQIIKPVTQGRVTLWSVDSDNNETQVAEYQPSETIPRFRRYKVPLSSGLTPNTLITPSSPTSLPSDVYSKADIDAMFGGGLTITVHVDGTHDLVPPRPFVQWFQRVIAQDNGGTPYTHKFTLDNSMAKVGAIFRIAVELAASTDPHIQIFDDDVTGTLLDDSAQGDSSNATFYFFEAQFDGTNWAKINAGFLAV